MPLPAQSMHQFEIINKLLALEARVIKLEAERLVKPGLREIPQAKSPVSAQPKAVTEPPEQSLSESAEEKK
jgi:hypothetical protein